jgi:hypothetical protein
MKNVFKFVLLLAFAVSAFAWTGCSKDDKKSGGGNSIIGTWERTYEEDIVKMEFKSGGQVIRYVYLSGVLSYAAKGEFGYTAAELTIEFSGSWSVDYNDANGNKFPDADEFVTTPNIEEKFSYIVSGNKLTTKYTDTAGGEAVYMRTTSPTPTTPNQPY